MTFYSLTTFSGLLGDATTQPVRAGIGLPAQWPATIDLLKEAETMSSGMAALLIVAGLVYLLFGFSFFKWLVTLNAAIVGAWIGAAAGKPADAAIPCAIIGGFIAAAVTWPTMKYSVAVMGGLFGAIVGASIWQTIGLESRFAWSGAGMGLILFGLLAFIIFRGSLMMYMSLQGAVMLVFGSLGLIYKLKDVGPAVTAKMTVAPFLLPMAIFIPAIVGIIYQQQTNPEAGPPPGKK
jgi:hypothetical protein